MVGGLILLNLVLVGGLLGWILDLDDGTNGSEGGGDEGGDGRSEPDPDPGPQPLMLSGETGVDEALTGGDGDDDLAGNIGDADTLIGGAGDDALTLAPGNTGTGGGGGDIFRVSDGATITDFTAGEDQLRILNAVDPSTENAPDIWEWETRADDVRLHRFDEGARTDFSDASAVVTLQGLDQPPPVDDLALFEIDDRQNDVNFVPGDEINFVQKLSSGSGNSTFELSDMFSVWELDAGGGRDVVVFDSFRGETDLGTGDDQYTSRAEIVFEDLAYDPFEIVNGGEGQDTIVGSQSPLVADGGPGDDDITFGGGSTVTGSAGEDVFRLDTRTFAGSIGDEPQINDFDPVEDRLVVMLGDDYTGAGELTFEDDTLFLDGSVILVLRGAATDLTGISILRV